MAESPQRARSTRRDFLRTAGLAAGIGSIVRPARLERVWGPGLKSISASHSVSTFAYGQHLVAAAKKLFEEEGLKNPDFVVHGGGAKVVQALAAGQGLFALGDSNHPLKITEKGRTPS
jgi:ABC-type nitrate/sulfonate/bicarbonate transport system substrate-binding protein